MVMIRSLDDLRQECKEKGLSVVQSGKRPAKDDFVKALQGYFLSKLPDVPKSLDRMLSLGEPMMCFPYWHLKESDI